MTLRNLVQKVFSSKRAELWQCPKAKRVKQGTRVIHGAGPYIGVFSVGSVKTTTTVREALTLYGHQKFVVKSPSFNASIEFYYHLFTGKTGLEAALKWDETPGREYYAWTDSILEAYIILNTYQRKSNMDIRAGGGQDRAEAERKTNQHRAEKDGQATCEQLQELAFFRQ